MKQKFLDLLDITDTENEVFKIRNNEGILVPLTDVLLQDSSEKLFLIDITNVHHDGMFYLIKIYKILCRAIVPAMECTSPLHSIYVDAVKNRLRTMESRVNRVESFVPQLKYRRQSLLERTTLMLESRVAFLDRRIDELTPAKWNEYTENGQLRENLQIPQSE